MMKSILAIIAMAPLATFAAPAKQARVAEEKSEISPGTIEIRGDSNLGLLTQSVKTKFPGGSVTEDTTTFALGLTGLYYFLPVGPGILGIGGTLAYEDVSVKVAGQKSGVSTFKLAPRAGIDFPLAPQISAYGFGELAYLRLTEKEPGASDVTAGLWGIGLGGGVKYFITRSLSADAGLILEWATGSADSPGSPDVTRTNFGLQVGLSGYFGLPKQ
jgi:opacity protein-like surface antigen